MSERSITATVVLAALAAAVHAQEAKKTDKPAGMEMPKPAPEMANLAVFAGDWSCSGQGAMEPGGAMMPMTTSVSAHSDLGGFWNSGRVKGATPGLPPFEGMFHMTYDAAAKNYLMLWVDSMGAWSEARASGWQDDKIVFNGVTVMGGQKINVRDTFTRGRDGSLGHVGEMEMGGKYSKVLDETCRKGPGR